MFILRTMLALQFATLLVCSLLNIAHAGTLGGPDPDFVSHAQVIESFNDEYSPGHTPSLYAVGIARTPGSARFLSAYVAYDSMTPNTAQLGLVRHHLDGSLDATFGGSGVAGMLLVSWPTASSEFRPSVAVMGSDGKLLVAAYVRNLGDPALFDVAICRLLAAGNFDSSFGDGGCRRLPILSDNGKLFTINMVPDHAGGAYISGFNEPANGYVVQRVDGDGDVDPMFGVAGVFTLFPPASDYAEIIGMTVLDDGRLVLVGSTYSGGNSDWLVVRLLEDGQEDASFGGNDTGYRKIFFDLGVDPNAVTDKAFTVTELSNGDLAICGAIQTQQMPTVSYGIGLLRLSVNGVTLDPDYGTANTDSWTFSQVALSSYCYDLRTLPDDGVLASGYQTTLGSDSDPAMLVVDAQGNLDPRFWQGGITVLSIDRTSNPGNTGKDQFDHAIVDADLERVVLLGSSEGPEDDRREGLLYSVALHDRLFRDGLENQ